MALPTLELDNDEVLSAVLGALEEDRRPRLERWDVDAGIWVPVPSDASHFRLVFDEVSL